MVKNLYVVLAILLLLCLAPMPYGYFMLVRFVMMVAFGFLAYRYFMLHKHIAMWVFVILAMLFQPFYKIVLGRVMWNAVDVIVAAFLVILFFMERRLGKIHTTVHQPLANENNPKLDNRIKFKIGGKLSPKELLFVSTEEDKQLTELFEKNPDLLEGWGKMIGFHIIYLPLLIKNLKRKEVIQYRAPYLSEEELAEVNVDNDYLLQYLDNVSDRGHIKQGFIRTEDVYRDQNGDEKVTNRFYPISSKTNEPIGDQLHRIGKQIFEEQNFQNRYLESVDEWGEPNDNTGYAAELDLKGEDDTDYLLEDVKEKIAKLRQRGISQYILEQLIQTDDKLSRIVVTKDYRIVLPDYHNMEIKMEPINKAVYLLFLRHPEGIIFKHLPDHRKELAEIYQKIKPFGLNDRAIRSIEDVTNPFLNSINEKCARIRGAFISQFDDKLAKHYYIYGERGEAKRIALPHNMVVWE